MFRDRFGSKYNSETADNALTTTQEAIAARMEHRFG
jgi:hypothetical protein